MHIFIRFVGVLNAAVWFGAAVFFTVAVGPAFFSAEILEFLPRPYAGRVAEVILERYFILQQWCAAIALLHLLVEYLYSGRPADHFTVGLLGVLLCIGLAGGYWLQPRMHALQRARYSSQTTPAQKADAERAFGLLHGASQVVNLLSMAGLLYHVWRVTRPLNEPRFSSFDKFRS